MLPTQDNVYIGELDQREKLYKTWKKETWKTVGSGTEWQAFTTYNDSEFCCVFVVIDHLKVSLSRVCLRSFPLLKDMSGGSENLPGREGWFGIKCHFSNNMLGLALPGNTMSQRERYLSDFRFFASALTPFL